MDVPRLIKISAAMGISVLMVPAVSMTAVIDGPADLLLAALCEAAVGCVLGYVFNIYFYMISFAGELLDDQFGITMGRVLDPLTHVSASVTGRMFEMLFMVYIFITNSHLIFIKLLISSYDTVKAGTLDLDISGISKFGIKLFISVFSLAVRLAAPFIAAAVIIEAGLGILMRLIPQLNMFVMNMQIKMLALMLMLMLMAKPVTVFMENYIISMFDSMQQALCRLV